MIQAAPEGRPQRKGSNFLSLRHALHSQKNGCPSEFAVGNVEMDKNNQHR
jgi:hypothetical protein